MGPGHKVEWFKFAEKVQMAIESSRQSNPEGGTSGLEVELNILDGDLQPVASVGSGPERRSFADYLHDDRLPEWAETSFQLEVFHWMIELTTRPHFSAVATAAESRLLEAVLLNTLAELELSHGEAFGDPARQHPAPVQGGRRLRSLRLESRQTALPREVRRALRRAPRHRRNPHQPQLSRGPPVVGLLPPSAERPAADDHGGLSQPGGDPSHSTAAALLPACSSPSAPPRR